MRLPRLLLMFVLFILTNLQSGTCQSIQGKWINELGSVLVIDSVAIDQTLHGEYRSSSGVDGQIFPLQGWINCQDNGTLAIAFTVKWDGYGSITSWTGYRGKDDQGTFLKTLWHLVRPGEGNEWERIITNASVFRPTD